VPSSSRFWFPLQQPCSHGGSHGGLGPGRLPAAPGAEAGSLRERVGKGGPSFAQVFRSSEPDAGRAAAGAPAPPSTAVGAAAGNLSSSSALPSVFAVPGAPPVVGLRDGGASSVPPPAGPKLPAGAPRLRRGPARGGEPLRVSGADSGSAAGVALPSSLENEAGISEGG